MVDVDSNINTYVNEYSRTASITQILSLHKDPSFSRWCVAEERVHFDLAVDGSNFSKENLDFPLPLFHLGDLRKVSAEEEIEKLSSFTNIKEQQMKPSDDFITNSASNHDAENENEKFVPFDIESDKFVPFDIENDKFVPFDIENDPMTERSILSSGFDESESSSTQEILPPPSKSSFSVSDVLKTLFLILVWYIFSTFLTLYNKTLLGDHLGKFPAPLLMNTFHFAMQTILSKAVTWYWSYKSQTSVAMSWRDYFVRDLVINVIGDDGIGSYVKFFEIIKTVSKLCHFDPDRWTLPFTVVPLAIGTAMEVNLSNASLVFISVTFATMCKSATPVFLLVFAFAFRLESPSVKLFGIITVISIGILLTVAKETQFEFWGFAFVMLAAVMSGFRWCMTQILLQKESYGLKNPFTLMANVAPVMTLITGGLSLILDPWHEFRTDNYFDSSWHIARSCFLMIFGGTLAFIMVMTEYILVSVTSAVTVTIAGVVKEAITILVAVLYFHDKFTWLKGAGLLTIMLGVGLFNWYKYEKLHKGQTDNGEGIATSNKAAQYVILEEMDGEEDRVQQI